MPAERLVNKNQKRMVLACFKAEIPCRIISREMDIPLAKVLYWEKLFQKGNWTWAKESDPALLLRHRAFELFSQGFGYKRVATLLNLPQSRVKYWQLLFQNNLEEFFKGGAKRKRRFTKEEKIALIEKFSQGSLSKKQFSVQNGISVSALNQWLRS
ncbi:MAG TPA: hypothetical protein IAC45_03790 [Candidatus Aphodousia faecavium]|nr:hypothetical protein [Candidatus Aphodousia faecavium]